jgi:hypothetical protein
MDVANLLTVKQIAELNPALPESTIRWWTLNAEKNGFDKCIRIRTGSERSKRCKIFIDRAQFEKWARGAASRRHSRRGPQGHGPNANRYTRRAGPSPQDFTSSNRKYHDFARQI